MKNCYICNIPQPETHFYKDKYRADGLTNRCRKCHKLHVRKLQIVVNRRRFHKLLSIANITTKQFETL